ncbi:MAG: conjugal transfer protein TraC, partial [Desulfovibrio fairfieldensis]|nr:conjugal transfer protein TraC [Desulfovibrio fairfieldensis]
MNAVFASRVVTKETTLEGSMRNDTGASAQSLSPSVRQPFERGELLMTTAIGHANGQPTKLLSPFVRLGDSPTTGASPAGNGWCDFNTA